MRVLIVLREFYCHSFPVGGAERQALKLAGELKRLGVPVTIVTGLWEWSQPHCEIIQGIPVDRHFSAWGMFGIKGLRKFGFYSYMLSLFLYLLWHRNEYDIIHCHSALVESCIGVLVGHWLNKPTLIRPMASGVFGDFKRMREGGSFWNHDWLVRQLRRTNAIVALNPQIADEMVALGITKDRIIFIPNGVEIEPAPHQRSYTQHEPMRIAFVGRLHPQKSIDTLVNALGYLEQESPDLSWRLQLAGTGPSRPELQAMANDLGIGHCVEFMGHIDCVDTLLEQCDCFVLPSLSEGMSNALLEAMALGLPCIATDIAGNNNLIQHQRNGWLVSPNDDKALAEAIVALATNEGLRQRLGQEALKTVQDNYSLHSVAQQYADLYADLLRNKKG
jgi:glycosyltransferase involved in cell wall biosynthesis